MQEQGDGKGLFGEFPSNLLATQAKGKRERCKVALMIVFGTSYTGGPRVVKNLVSSLDCARFEPFVITNKESPLTSDLRELGVRYAVVDLPADVATGGRSVQGWRNKFNTFTVVLSSNRKIAGIIRREGIRLLWARNIKSVLLAGVAARRAKIPMIWDIGMEKNSRGLVRHLHNFGFRIATKVITEGYSVAGTIFSTAQLEKFGGKISVIRSGIPEDRVREIEDCVVRVQRKPADDIFRIINIASICDRKNQRYILDAIAPLLKSNKKLKLDFVGPIVEPEYAQSLRVQIEKDGLGAQVQLHGWRADATEMLANSDLFVLGSRVEGVPYSILEAMHSGVPIVSTPCGGVPDVIEDGQTGVLCVEGKPESMQFAVAKLIEAPELRKYLKTQAVKFVRSHYSVNQWAQNYMQLFHELTEENL